MQRRLSTSSSLVQDDTYALIISALEQIEDEERKQSATELIHQLGDFILKSQRNSPIQFSELLSRSNSRQGNESKENPHSEDTTPNANTNTNELKRDHLHKTLGQNGNEDTNSLPASARSYSSSVCTSASREIQKLEAKNISNKSSASTPRPKSVVDSMWETADEKTKYEHYCISIWFPCLIEFASCNVCISLNDSRKIFSFLDEVEKTDRETLFSLKFEQPVPKGSEDNNLAHNAGKSFVRENTTCMKKNAASFTNPGRIVKSDVSYQT